MSARHVAVVALALSAAACGRSGADPYAEEVKQREALAKRLMNEADAGRALLVTSTSEVQFGEGFGKLSFELDPDQHPSFTNHAFRWMGQNAHVRLKSHGAVPMKIRIDGWVHLKVIGTQPVIQLFVDGVYIAQTDPVGGGGHFRIDARVPEWAIRRPWVDLVIHTNAVGFHWGDPPELNVINIYRFEWGEAN
ncbi:MAG: hypothetical protein KC657_18310 [Myxococcales bacterium]|nr:hypothetical protein [Myxococcales bacterium]